MDLRFARTFWFLCQAMVALPAFAGGNPSSHFALIIGHNQPDSDRMSNLLYADDDAISMYYLFTQNGITSTLLVDMDENTRRMNPQLAQTKKPTLQNVLDAFDTIADRMLKVLDQEPEFYFYYSGHGDVQKGEGLLMLDQGHLYRRDLFQKILSRSPARQNHVIIDACNSYFIIGHNTSLGIRTPYRKPTVVQYDPNQVPHTGFVLSTASARDSHEWERYQAGIFSHLVRSGLRGGADADQNGRITYAELGAFLRCAHSKGGHTRFRSDFVIKAPGKPPGELSKTIFSWQMDQDVLLIDQDAGHFYVENDRRQRLLDAHAKKGHPIRLRLPTARPLYIRKQSPDVEYAITTSGTIHFSNLLPRPTSTKRKDVGQPTFDSLFSQPFGAQDILEFERQYIHFAAELDQGAPVPVRSIIETAAFWSGLGAVTIGGACSLAAFGLYAQRSQSQQDSADINRHIRALNISAVVFYSLAGAASMTWLASLLWPKDEFERRFFAIFPAIGPDSLGISAHLRWIY